MEESPHCALSGEGALEFALSLGNFDEICTPKDLKGDDCPYQTMDITNPEFETFSELMYTGGPICETPNQQARDNAGAVASEQSLGETQEQQGHDTVNAVAMDHNGYLACANSSGTYLYYTNQQWHSEPDDLVLLCKYFRVHCCESNNQFLKK